MLFSLFLTFHPSRLVSVIKHWQSQLTARKTAVFLSFSIPGCHPTGHSTRQEVPRPSPDARQGTQPFHLGLVG